MRKGSNLKHETLSATELHFSMDSINVTHELEVPDYIDCFQLKDFATIALSPSFLRSNDLNNFVSFYQSCLVCISLKTSWFYSEWHKGIDLEKTK